MDAGKIKGGISFDISEYAHGMLEAEAIAKVFPATVVEFLEHPLIGFTELAKEAFHAVGEAIEGTFELAAEAVHKLFENTRETAEEFHKMGLAAAETGLDVEQFSLLAKAAHASGLSVEQLTNGFFLLQERAALALTGDAGAAKGFQAVGIRARELKSLLKDPEEMFYRVSDALAAIATQGERAYAAKELFGRGGGALLPFMQQGSSGIQDFMAELKKAGAGVTEEEESMGAAFGRFSEKWDAGWMRVKKAAAEPILGFLRKHSDELFKTLDQLTNVISHELGPALSKTLDKIGPWLPIVIPMISEAARNIWDMTKAFGGLAIAAAGALEPIGAAIEKILPSFDTVKYKIREVTNGLEYLKHLMTGSAFTPDIEAFTNGAFRPATNAGPSSTPQVQVGPNNFAFDTAMASSQVAHILQPKMRQALQRQQQELVSLARRQQVMRRAGGKR